MRKLYREKEVLFALLWIIAYCFVMTPLKGNYGYGSAVMMLAVAVFAVSAFLFVKRNHLEQKYGLSGWPKDMKRYLYFLPMFILATGNLWDGFALSYRGTELVTAVISMILIGFIEEMIFRGFLFMAMLAKDKPAVAVTVVSLTFGIGHIVNLFAGQGGLETALQVVFAVSWGFMLTMAFYKSGSLLPSIVVHAMIDVFSLFGAESGIMDRIYIGVTVVTAAIYCIYLSRLKENRLKA
jgi:hypothetical protein